MLFVLLMAGLAQTGSASAEAITPPPAYVDAANAFGQCIGDASVSPPRKVEASKVAKQAIAACGGKRSVLDAQLVAWVDGPSYPASQRNSAHISYDKNMAELPHNIAAAVRKNRRVSNGGAYGAFIPAEHPQPAPVIFSGYPR